MVVYCGLLSVFATLFMVSLPSRQNASFENLSYSAEQSGAVLAKIQRDVAQSYATFVSIGKDGDSLLLPSPLDTEREEYTYDKEGHLLWRSWVEFSLEDGHLNRFEYLLPRALVLSDLEAFPDLRKLRKGSVRLMASEVSEFRVERVKGALRVQLAIDIQGERVRHVTSMAARQQ